MYRFTVLILTLAVSSRAADFRALNIGESCATVREWEIAKGSTLTQSPEGSSKSYWLGFRGNAFGRDVYLSYLCRDGLLFTGNYMFPVESLDKAVESYRQIHDDMLSIYGDTSMDESPWNGNIGPMSTSLESPKYTTSWISAQTLISLSLMRNQPSEEAGWQVFIVVGPSHSATPPTEKH